MLTTNIRGLILLHFKEVLRLLRSQYCAVRSETTKGSWDRELCLRLPETTRNRFLITSKQGYFFRRVDKTKCLLHKLITQDKLLGLLHYESLSLKSSLNFTGNLKFKFWTKKSRYRLILDLIPGVVAPAPGVYFDSDKGGTDVCQICY